MHIRW